MTSPVSLRIAALALVFAAPAAANARYAPCRTARKLVTRSLAGAIPKDLDHWPLYEAELSFDRHTQRLKGRLQVTLAAAEGAESVVLVLPSLREPGGIEPMTVGAARSAVGDAEPGAARVSTREGVVTVSLERRAKKGEKVTVLLELRGQVARLEAGSFSDAANALAPGGAHFRTLGGFATDGVGGLTLLSAYPTLAPVRKDGKPWVVAPARFGAPVPAPPACHLSSFVVPSGLGAFATGTRVGVVKEEDGRERHLFAAAGARRFTAVFRPTTEVLEVRAGRVTIRIGSKDTDLRKRMGEWAKAALVEFRKRYGPYPYRELDITTVPMSGALGGLRGPGVVLVNDLLAGPGPASAFGEPEQSRDLAELIVVHQVALQWFGELAGTPGPDEPVTEEVLSFAAVMEYARARYGEKSARKMRVSLLDSAYTLWRALGSPDGPADRPTRELDVGAWTALCEGKAPNLIGALEKLVGRTATRKAIRRWVDQARYDHGDRRSLEKQFLRLAPPGKKKRVRATFVRWLDEAHGDEDIGVPADAAGAKSPMLKMLPGMSQPDMAEMMELLSRMLQGF